MHAVSLLLPTKGRYDSLIRCLKSLSDSIYSPLVEVVVVCDHDHKGARVASEFLKENELSFNKYKVLNSVERVFSVAAFNIALQNSSYEHFIWISNTLTFDKEWLIKVVTQFDVSFPDEVGVLAIGGKMNKANFGMSSKSFVRYNEGEWFSSKYRMNFCDDELTVRAILLGRYKLLNNSGVHMNPSSIDNELLYKSYDEKIMFKKIDRRVFYERLESNFNLPENKIYPWKGFREINETLKEQL